MGSNSYMTGPRGDINLHTRYVCYRAGGATPHPPNDPSSGLDILSDFAYSLFSPFLTNRNAKYLKVRAVRGRTSKIQTTWVYPSTRHSTGWRRRDASNDELPTLHGERRSNSDMTRQVTHSPCRAHTGSTASSPPSPPQEQTSECRPAKKGQRSRKLAMGRRAIDGSLRGQRRLQAQRPATRSVACIGSNAGRS